MERGEVWWARVDERRPVVLLSGGEESEFRAMQIVDPATEAEKRGFVVLPGEAVADAATMRAAVASATAAATTGAGIGPRAVGVEVGIGAPEGLPRDGVVRIGLPRDGHIYCTWLVTLTREYLIERAGVLSPTKLRQLENALLLGEVELGEVELGEVEQPGH